MGGTVFETTINSTCKGHLSQAGGLYIFASCTGTPPTTANVFAKGCLMIQTDASSHTTYENTGTSASPSWDLIGASIAGDIALTNGSVLVGNASNVAAGVSMSGDATIANTGAVTIANAAVSPAKQTTAARTRVVSVPFKLPAPTGANQGPFTFPLSACSQASTIVSVKILSNTATSGSNATNQYQFQARNITQAADLHTVITSTQGSELSATTAKTVTLSQNLSFAANDVLGLKVDISDDVGAGPTDLSGANLLCVIEYTI